MDFLLYIAKSAGILSLFYLIYRFVLNKDTFFTANRAFLISGIIAAFLLPILSFDHITYVILPAIENIAELNFDAGLYIDSSLLNDTNEAYEIDWVLITAIIYSSGLALFFLRVCFQIVSVFRLIKSGNIVSKNKFTFIEVSNTINPFSFFDYIVYNPIKHSREELEMILAHEQVHAGQKHSIDILITQSILCLQWFNPLAWLYKKSLEQNLEYLADNEAIQKTNNIKQYQHTLVKVSSTSQTLALINPFYQSFIKKRIVMLNKPQSHKRNLWKFTLVLPLLACFMYSFNVKDVIEYVDEETLAFAKAESILPISDNTFYITKSSTPNDLDHIEKQIAQLYPDAKVRFSKRKTFDDGTIKQFSFQTKFKGDNSFSTRFNREKDITPDWKGYEIKFTTNNDIILKELNENGVSFKLDIDKLTLLNDFNGTIYDRALVPSNETYQESKKGSYKRNPSTNPITIKDSIIKIPTLTIDSSEDLYTPTKNTKDTYRFKITKNTQDLELEALIKTLKENHNAFLKVKDLKRNTKDEITAIRLYFIDSYHNAMNNNIHSNTPINDIYIYREEDGTSGMGIYPFLRDDSNDLSKEIKEQRVVLLKRRDSLRKNLKKRSPKERRYIDSITKNILLKEQEKLQQYKEEIKNNRALLQRQSDSVYKTQNIKNTSVQTDEKAGYIKLDDTTYYYVKADNGNITYYDKWGQKIDESDSIYERLVNAPYFYVDNETVDDVKKRIESYGNISTLLQTIAIYYLNGKKISYEEMEIIDPKTITKVNVLKGEEAIKLYGEEARNGVIIIETK